MQTEFWLERWEQNQIGFHEDEVNCYLKLFSKLFETSVKNKIFVPFCGKSKDMIWLRSQGFDVFAVELSPIAVKNFFSENNLKPKITNRGAFQCWEAEGICIYLGDFFDLTDEDLSTCFAIYDRASLIALPENMRQNYVEHLKIIAGGVTQKLLITLEYDQLEMQGPPFSVDKNLVEYLFENEWDIQCLLEDNILNQNDHFIQRGLTSLVEKAYFLNKK